MMPLFFGILGLFCGFAFGVQWGVVGGLFGFLLGAHLETRKRLSHLEKSLASLTKSQAAEASAERVACEPQLSSERLEPETVPIPSQRPHVDDDNEKPVSDAVGEKPSRALLPSLIERIRRLLWDYFTGGNSLVRIGIVVLFFGVAFLLKYAAEQAWLPIELRLIGVALGGVLLLVLGWRLRKRRFGYGLALQGGGVGLLYLTVFAAYRLYGMLPALPAFAILVACALLSALIAVLQDARALAVLAVAGGFLAPVLASTGQGDHVALFSYYLVLNASILGVAWFKAWRSLNVVGFAFTFVIASLWGYRYYRPAYFSTTEPFLILFFLFYVAIAVLFALRQPPHLKGYVDGTLVFGTPLIGFGLQAALVSSYEYGLAWSALALGAFYLTLAWILLRRSQTGMRILAEALVAVGVVFATLAIPLGLDARWTSAMWALEGAALVWVGIRQARPVARWSGIALQLGAGVSFGLDLRWSGETMAFLNADYLGTVILAIGGSISAFWLWRGRGALLAWEGFLEIMLFAWAVLWWLGGGVGEVFLRLAEEYRWGGLVMFLGASALLADRLERISGWPLLRYPALGLLPALALVAVLSADFVAHPFAQLGFLGWPFALATHYLILKRLDDQGLSYRDWFHAGGLWLMTAVVTWELAWAVDRAVQGAGTWELVTWGLVPALTLLGLLSRGRRLSWPIGRYPRAYLHLGPVPLAGYAWLWLLFANLSSPGDPWPLLYLPLLNPLDVAIGFALAALLVWLRENFRARMFEPVSPVLVYGATVFLWLNAILIRTMHHWAGISFTLEAMLGSQKVQAGLTLLWSTTGVIVMLIAARRKQRLAWLAGAGLMAVVVAKLFLVDLAATGTVERIVAFLGVGVLLLVVGYFAPVPPRRTQETVSP